MAIDRQVLDSHRLHWGKRMAVRNQANHFILSQLDRFEVGMVRGEHRDADVGVVCQEARGQLVVGLMGTPATLKLGLYQGRLVQAGHRVIELEEGELKLCVQVIDAVKGSRTDSAFAPAADCIRRLRSRGADVVVLGCTELPLAVPHAQREGLGILLTDSIDALARAAIQHCRVHLGYSPETPTRRVSWNDDMKEIHSVPIHSPIPTRQRLRHNFP